MRFRPPLQPLAACALFLALGTSLVPAQTPETGQKFPAFEGTTHDGKKVALSDYAGKVVLIDFWATWCGPCVHELPNVKEAYARYRDDGFEVVGISLDSKAEALERWQENPDTALPWPSIFDGKGWGSELAGRFGIRSIPATFLLNREGVVIATNLRGGRLAAEVEKALGGDIKAMFAEWVMADAEARENLEERMMGAARGSRRAQRDANEAIWAYLDEHKPARPSPKGAALCLELLKPTVEGSRDYAVMDTAGLAAHLAGDHAKALEIQTKAIEIAARTLKKVRGAGGVEDNPLTAELLSRQALYFALAGQPDKAAEVIGRIDASQGPDSPARQSKYYGQAKEAIEKAGAKK